MNFALLEELQRNKETKASNLANVQKWLIGDSGISFTHEVTLTFPLDPKHDYIAEKIYGIFKDRLIDRCYKKKAKEDIKMAVILEGEISYKRLHYHCAMRCPEHMTSDYFSRRILKTWHDTVRNNSARVVIKPYTNEGWIDYITKEFNSLSTSTISEHTSF